jgi:ATP-dependent exoDNAse (exonuclease V) beta subunit
MFKYLDILQDFVLQKSNDLTDFISYFELNKSNFSIACPDHMNAITITSIHKSKGLEYPVVILPFSTWTHQADGEKIWFDIAELDFEELYVEDREKISHYYGRINSKEIIGYDSMELQAKSEKDAIFLDALNMLYVATTRAKQRLHILLAKPNISAHFRSHTVFKQSIGQMLLDFATENFDLPTADNQDDCLPIYYCFHGSLAGSRKVQKKLKEANIFEIELNATLHEVPDFRIKSSKADLFTMAEEKRRKGDLIHDFLASFSGLSNLENQLEPLDDELQNLLRALLSNPSIKDLFIDEELLFVETDILCPDGTTFRPDRVILKEGKTLVIDYKTGVEKEKHRIQLSNYKNILSQMGFSNIQGLLVYLSDQRLEYV